MKSKYHKLVAFLEDSTNNIADFMTGRMFLFEDRTRKDREYDSLLIAKDFNHTVQSLIEVILPTFCSLSVVKEVI